MTPGMFFVRRLGVVVLVALSICPVWFPFFIQMSIAWHGEKSVFLFWGAFYSIITGTVAILAWLWCFPKPHKVAGAVER